MHSGCLYDQQRTIFFFHSAKQQQNKEYSTAADGCYHKIANTTADTNNDRPENIDSITAVFDRRSETNDGQGTDHTKGQGNIIADNCHDHSCQYRKRHQCYIKLSAIDRT